MKSGRKNYKNLLKVYWPCSMIQYSVHVFTAHKSRGSSTLHLNSNCNCPRVLNSFCALIRKNTLRILKFYFPTVIVLSLLCSTMILPKMLPSLSNFSASFNEESQRPEEITGRGNNLRDRQRWQENRNRIQFYPLEMKVIISHLVFFEFLINCFTDSVKIFQSGKISLMDSWSS